MSTTPTVVLVHGGFVDASTYAPVVRQLLSAGLRVVAPPLSSRSLLSDADYLSYVVRRIEGPVLLVGHAYGGAVITIAGKEDNVVGLVYLAAYVLDEGETMTELRTRFAPSLLAESLVFSPYPAGGLHEQRTEVSVDTATFARILGADLNIEVAATLAASQRPIDAGVFGEASPALPAWANKPAWGIVTTNDRVVNPDMQRFGYTRARATISEIDSSHLVMLAHPEDVVAVIQQALRTADGP